MGGGNSYGVNGIVRTDLTLMNIERKNMMRRMTNEEAILNLETIFAKYKFSEEESKLILKSFSVLFHNPVGTPLTLEQLCEMEGKKVILYRMKSTEPLEPGTVKRNGDVLGDFGTLAYHELYLETWVAFSCNSAPEIDSNQSE